MFDVWCLGSAQFDEIVEQPAMQFTHQRINNMHWTPACAGWRQGFSRNSNLFPLSDVIHEDFYRGSNSNVIPECFFRESNSNVILECFYRGSNSNVIPECFYRGSKSNVTPECFFRGSTLELSIIKIKRHTTVFSLTHKIWKEIKNQKKTKEGRPLKQTIIIQTHTKFWNKTEKLTATLSARYQY